MKLWKSLLVLVIFILGCGSSGPTESIAEVEQEDNPLLGFVLFNAATFGGNGRTCSTCHIGDTGTVSPEQAKALFAAHPSDPLFRSIDSDDGLGVSYTRLLNNATMRIPLPLPSNVVMEDDPTARTVFLNRGVPSTNDVGLLSILMYDGRETALPHQAVSAVHTHYQNTIEPTPNQAQAIADFQKDELFSSLKLRKFAKQGAVPSLPVGYTAAQKRGRTFFVGDHKRGLCAQCHDGPMLNETNAFNILAAPGSRFATNFSAELNEGGNPVHTFAFSVPNSPFAVNGVVRIHAPDPGIALITGDPCSPDPAVCFLNPVPGFANIEFKIPSLWGVSKTAPYFHDSSAKSFDDLMVHYQTFFAITAQGTGDPDFFISNDEASDIKAFLALL